MQASSTAPSATNKPRKIPMACGSCKRRKTKVCSQYLDATAQSADRVIVYGGHSVESLCE